MSEIQQAMFLLINAFHKYSGKEGDDLNLSKGELRELFKHELKEPVEKSNEKDAIEAIFNDLDRNQDNKVDFSEYVALVGRLTQLCHEFFMSKTK